MNTNRAPKQWSLTKHKSITTFEAWRQNLQYSLSLDSNFALFLANGMNWQKTTVKPNPLPVAVLPSRRTCNLNCCLFLYNQNSIAKNSTSINSIWQSIRAHYGFQSTGPHFLYFSNIKLEAGERPVDLYQMLMSFTEDSLLVANGNITHHGDVIAVDEELTQP